MSSQSDYPEYSEEIDKLLKIKRRKWTLRAVAWLQWEDVAQMIRLHIFKKLHKYDRSKPFGPWVNKIIGNQRINILRNNYSSFSKPCTDCPMDDGDDLCRFTLSRRKCSECPFYAKWEKRKKQAYNVKLPLSLDANASICDSHCNSTDIDVEHAMKILKEKLKEKLTKNEYAVFSDIYLYDSSPENKKIIASVGYRQIQNYKQKILLCSKKIIMEDISRG